jgi:3-hydroxyisobutyrate dehydrogenase-like beta-hydroxyacid dehydrogenase
MRIGFIGAGRMGRPMVRRLIDAGCDVRVLGRSTETRRVLEAEGVPVVTDVSDLAHGADAVLVCVYNDEQVRQVCLDGDLLHRMSSGSTLVVHTTGSPRTVEAIAARAASRGVDVVDSPVSGGPHDVAVGRVTLFVGGADDTVARMRPVLCTYGDPVLHVGPLGAGQLVKLINNALFASQIGLLSEAIRLGSQLGVAEQVLLNALPHGSAASRAVTFAVTRGSVATVAKALGDFVGKDVDVVRKVASELGADLGALNSGLDAMADAIALANRSLNGRSKTQEGRTTDGTR